MARLPFFKYDEIFSDPVRLLVKESHAIFSTIPRTSEEMSKTNVITMSRRYRSIVHECVENLTKDIRCDHSEQIQTFKELEVIWNLCEILLLDVNQTGTLIIQLKNWIKMHFDDLDENSKNILRSLDGSQYRLTEADAQDTYWSLLIKLVLRGEIRKAVNLLSSHYEFERDDQMQSIAAMLEGMPLSNQYIAHEFYSKWANWSNWCKRERETGQFDSNPYLLIIARLLSQDKAIYDELASQCETWYQLMVAYLLYNDPSIKETDLSELCRRMISTFRTNQTLHQQASFDQEKFDEIIIAAFEYDLVQVIALSCSYLDDNWWFVTHFVDLLHCSNQLGVHEIVESDKLRESFLLDYAATLFDDEYLWPVGVSYLDSCPKSGLHHLEALLSRIPISINDEMKANKIVSIAKRRGLIGVAKSVQLLMSREWLAKTPRLTEASIDSQRYRETNESTPPHAVNMSNALYWAVKSGNTALTTYISDQYLYYYCKTGTFPDKNIFECLRRSPLDNERLAFLAKYYEFKQLNHESEDDPKEAGALLRALLTSQIYPKFFCQELLDDAYDVLLVRPQSVFAPDLTLDILKTVEEVTKGAGISDDMELRKKLVRNMAKALIAPVHMGN